MERAARVDAVSWLVLPAGAILVLSAVTLPSQPYTGLSLRGDQVARVIPGSPGQRADIQPGDRLSRPGRSTSFVETLRGPLSGARPGVPFEVVRERPGGGEIVRLVPEPLPAGERRMRTALLAVATGFVLLGGWVWSERRDRLTRPFYALALTFASLLAPLPGLDRLEPSGWLEVGYQILFVAVQLVLPALCIHFFALFPDSRAPGKRRSAGVGAGYGAAALLFLGSIGTLALRAVSPALAVPVLEVLQAAAALWFAAGLLSALALFARSYRRAGSADARRRLRVAWIGTSLGLAPLALLIALHLVAEVEVPGERLAVLATLLVPLSFAYAIAVHRVFDFRLALRAAAWTVVVAAVVAAGFLGVEAAFLAFGPPAGLDARGATLGLLVLGAALAGPTRPGLSAIGRRLVPHGDALTLSERFANERPGAEDDEALMERAARITARHLRLDRCEPLTPARSRAAPLGSSLDLGSGFLAALGGVLEPLPADDARFDAADRDALEAAGIHWVQPVSASETAATPGGALLLGRRLAGPWLDRREIRELGAFARELAVAVENATLKRAALSHGALDRELEQAHAIQVDRLPRRAPVYPTLDCAAATLASEAVGGDYYDFVQRSDRELTLVVGDAAGKGVPAALLLAGIQSRFRHEALRGQPPGRVLDALNRELVRLDQPDRFVGLLCARVEVLHGRLCLANAGLTPPLVRRRTGTYEEVTAGGLLLGVRAEARYPDTVVELAAGDLVLLYTDGLIEARRSDELFGLERVRSVLDRHAHRRARDVLQALLDAAAAFADRPLDDLTALVLKQLADPLPEGGVVRTAIPLKARFASADHSG
jgi:sigma-B regulation protein RsbU (phosphoserine phosphatase)